jgi:hypothetical protein
MDQIKFHYIPLNAKEIFLLMIEVNNEFRLYRRFEEYRKFVLILIKIDHPENNN